MILVQRFKEYFDHCVDDIKALKSAHIVATEEGLGQKIKDIGIDQIPFLVAVIPSADPDSRDTDSVKEKNMSVLFVLTKRDPQDKDESSFINDMGHTQDITKLVKTMMKDDKDDCDAKFHDVMKYLDVNSMHQDPEYNYLGCDGWSLSFQFDTIGF